MKKQLVVDRQAPVDFEIERLANDFLAPRISLEDYLNQLGQKVANLGLVPSQLTEDLFTRDRKSFDKLICDFRAGVTAIQSELIVFEARVASDFYKPPMIRRFLLWLVQIVYSRSGQISEVRNLLKRSAYLKAIKDFRKVVDECDGKVNGLAVELDPELKLRNLNEDCAQLMGVAFDEDVDLISGDEILDLVCDKHGVSGSSDVSRYNAVRSIINEKIRLLSEKK